MKIMSETVTKITTIINMRDWDLKVVVVRKRLEGETLIIIVEIIKT